MEDSELVTLLRSIESRLARQSERFTAIDVKLDTLSRDFHQHVADDMDFKVEVRDRIFTIDEKQMAIHKSSILGEEFADASRKWAKRGAIIAGLLTGSGILQRVAHHFNVGWLLGLLG